MMIAIKLDCPIAGKQLGPKHAAKVLRDVTVEENEQEVHKFIYINMY